MERDGLTKTNGVTKGLLSSLPVSHIFFILFYSS